MTPTSTAMPPTTTSAARTGLAMFTSLGNWFADKSKPLGDWGTSWRAPTPYSSMSELSFLSSLVFSLLLILSTKSAIRRLVGRGEREITSLIGFAVYVFCGFRGLLEIFGLGLVMWKKVDPKQDLNLPLGVFNCFADAFSGYVVTAMQSVCLTIMSSCLGYQKPLPRLNSRRAKFARFVTFAANALCVVSTDILASGIEGDDVDGSPRLGNGRRISVLLQTLVQFSIFHLFIEAHKRPNLWLATDTDAHPLAPSTRKAYMGQMLGVLILTTYCLVGSLSRAFPTDNAVSSWFQSPQVLHWYETLGLLILSSTLHARAHLLEAQDEGLIRLGEEEKEIDMPTDEQKVQLLIRID